MIEGTVPMGGRKRSVWWVDPVWSARTPFPVEWVAPFLVAWNVYAASPLPHAAPGGSWDRVESFVAGVAIVWGIPLLARGTRGIRGAWRLLCLAAVATTLASLPDFLRSIWQPTDGGRTWSSFATWAFGSIVIALVLDQVEKRRAATELAARQLREAKDAALRARLAPHFIFNALGTLQAQIEKDPRAATATSERLARLFRQALAAAGRPTVPLREELEFVEAYLGIERSRLGDRLRVKIEVPEELEEVEIPPLSLQVLVENAIQHGIAPREDGGEIRVRARGAGPGENPGIVLSVENPLAPSSRPGTGTGLEALRGRLRSPDDLTVSSASGAFHAEFWWSAA
jgi:hypothetical protein